MYTLFVIFILIAALLMIGIVLIQESKGGGLSSNFASYNQIGGVRKTTDFIEKATWGLAIAMIVLSVLSVAFLPSTNVSDSVIMQQATEQKATNPGNIPGIAQPSATEQPAEQAPAAEAPAAPAATEKN